MIIADYHAKVTGTEVSQMIYNSLKRAMVFPKIHKGRNQQDFKLFGIVPKKAVTSHTILDFSCGGKQAEKYKGLSTDHAERHIGECLLMKKFLYIPCFKKYLHLHIQKVILRLYKIIGQMQTVSFL